MKRSWIGGAGLVLALGLGLTACGSPRNCQVIPLQVELVKERRDRAVEEVRRGAREVDRARASLDQTRERIAELERERALLDSLYVED